MSRGVAWGEMSLAHPPRGMICPPNEKRGNIIAVVVVIFLSVRLKRMFVYSSAAYDR